MWYLLCCSSKIYTATFQVVALTSEGKFDSKATKKRTAKDECKSDKIISGKKAMNDTFFS